MLIRLVGLVSIEHESEAPRVLASHQAQIALARLCLERPSGTGREQLADTIWPDGLPTTWASALRSVVSRLRPLLSEQENAEPAVIACGGRYLLQLPEYAQVDVERAEQAAFTAAVAHREGDHSTAQRLATTAVSLLRGPFLASHESEWVESVRRHLKELRVSALETASSSSSALGDTHHALRYAEEAVRQAPFRESAYRCQMTAHRLAGNRAEALRIYQQLRVVLAEELGCDPSPESEAAYLGLLERTRLPVSPARAEREALSTHRLN
ncbi:bacterial transcriptional activator domain-containing protein [Streptomyces sp. SM11]|uniref:AfsR/SARP family transcriptional regulator n=1 Tax=Streptomyces sp. SM11 TaxID=565557 RepID=UPI000CD4D50A|nr:bacterial transcriptional activator domain-containing protein [Streptomyces sp. SM11]